MSIINMIENYKNLEGLKTSANVGDDEILGAKNAIRNLVEAKRGEANAEDKGKKGVLRKILANKAKKAKK